MSNGSQTFGRVHITGGRGRLSSIVAEHLRSRGLAVELYSRTVGEGFKSLSLLTNPEVVAAKDVVIHMAWSTVPIISEQSLGVEWAEDLPLLENLLIGLSKFGEGRKPHFVFFSSGGAVYGNAGPAPSRESDNCKPIGSYGRAKLAAERIVNQYQSSGAHWCAILRIANPYGYKDRVTRPQGVINRAIASALSGHEFVIWGDGGARKDYLYKDDFLAAVEKVVEYRLVGTYNICAGISHSVSEVLKVVELHTARRILRRHIPAPTWDVLDSRLDGSLMRQAASWHPMVSFSEGVRRAVELFGEK